eukprot:3695855-Rhodomonas_salina.1
MALHPVVMRVLDRHPGVFTVVYMDNVYLVSQLEATLAAASELADRMWQDLNLEVNTSESWIHAPAWARLGAAPDTLGLAL